MLANRWIVQRPTPLQALFLQLTEPEALFGGGGGGGKSSALLMGALQYADVPGYAALILRRSYADLALPEAIMDRAAGWLAGTAARWHGDTHTWTFPSGATLSFGYVANAGDRDRYRSAEFSYIAWDELTQFSEADYRFLFSRLRRPAGATVPLRVRAATNPGGIGHEWVRERWALAGAIDHPVHRTDGRAFVPALLADNPHVDQAAYRGALAELDPVTRAQIEHGDWAVRPAGNVFAPAAVRIVEAAAVPPLAARVRFWDLGGGGDPTAGVLMGYAPPHAYVLDVQRYTGMPGETEALIQLTAELDGRAVSVRVEREPGASGLYTAYTLLTRVLPGYDVAGVPPYGDKLARARPYAAAWGNGLVQLVRAPWNRAFVDEHAAFPQPRVHDDQVDAAAGAFGEVCILGAQAQGGGFSGQPPGARRRLTV